MFNMSIKIIPCEKLSFKELTLEIWYKELNIHLGDFRKKCRLFTQKTKGKS